MDQQGYHHSNEVFERCSMNESVRYSRQEGGARVSLLL